MKDKELLLLTVKISLVVQIISGIVSSFGIFIKLAPKDYILRDILIIETVVQIVEAIFYVYIYLSLESLDNNVITSRRYFDWVITTPIMLISTILFMRYNIRILYDKSKNKQNRQNKPKSNLTTYNVIKNNKDTIIKIVIGNFIMLCFGYLGEVDILSKTISIPIGFIFFFYVFYLIWREFGSYTQQNQILFWVLFIVWGLYGVSACLPVLQKNICYNILDIISKNFYGLYIFYYIYQHRLVV
tara:strand:- start:37 stop:765 length:729 start_codon:yes stop_codon:yes gene_type:complete